ncbi:TRAP transporter small permease [Stutzerimonas stutzeri]|uniref:TRAP transporter small permease n=1 Tax=Stutzerimonas stutzeri TaxID=316 RepID=UPI000775F152|nr:TRAP transporter small permease [Stutzerimonas stutzeri]KXO83849.1 hypothetical protein AYK87_06785 [Stutzerimonas stutzeri]
MHLFLRSFYFLVNTCAVLAAVCVALLIAIIGAEAIFRSLGWGLFRGVIDLSEYGLFIIAVLGAPWLLARNKHIKVDFLAANLKGAYKSCAQLIVNLLMLFICGVIFYYSLIVLGESFMRDDYIYKELEFPDWWLQWQVPLSMLLMFIEVVLRMAKVERDAYIMKFEAEALANLPNVEA